MSNIDADDPRAATDDRLTDERDRTDDELESRSKDQGEAAADVVQLARERSRAV